MFVIFEKSYFGGPSPPLLNLFIIFGDVSKNVSKTSSANIVTTYCSKLADFHKFFKKVLVLRRGKGYLASHPGPINIHL